MGFPINDKMRQYLRMRDTFSPEAMVGTTPYVPEPAIRDPLLETPQADRYYAALQEPMPERKAPGWGRRLAATFSRPEEVDEVHYGPYNRAMRDRQTKLQELEKGANIEKGYRGQDVINAKNYNSAIVGQLNAGTRAANTASQIDDRAKRTQLAQATLEFARYKQEHPDEILRPVPGGNFVWFNPQTLKTTETQYKSGDLPELEEIDRRGGWSVKAAEANAAARTATQEAGDWREVTGTDGKKYRINPTKNLIEPMDPTGTTTFPVPGSGGADNQSNNDRTAGVLLRLSQFRTKYPDVEVETDIKGLPIGIKVPTGASWGGWGSGGLTPEQVATKKKQYEDFLFDGTPIPPDITSPAAPAPRNPRPNSQFTRPENQPPPRAETNANIPPPGKIRVKVIAGPNKGKTGSILLTDFDPKVYEKLPIEAQLQAK